MSESELISLQRANEELRALNESLRSAQDQLLQSERLASIGQLAAGVAHEINNPIGYVFSNFGTLEAYLGACSRCSKPTSRPKRRWPTAPSRPGSRPCASGSNSTS